MLKKVMLKKNYVEKTYVENTLFVSLTDTQRTIPTRLMLHLQMQVTVCRRK